MTASVADTPLPRADAAERPLEAKGFFPFGDTTMRGLDLAFWLLVVFLVVGFAAIDEEWPSVAKFRPRLILGSLALLVAGVRAGVAGMTTAAGPVLRDRVTTAWMMYVFATVMATLWAFQFELSWLFLLQRLPSMLMFAMLLAMVRTRREFLVLILFVCAAYGFYLLRSFMEFRAGRQLVTMGVVRMVGAGSVNADPNSFAATLVFSMPIMLWAGIFTRSWFLRFCVACYGALSIYAVILTRSRSGLILILLTILWFLTALPTRKARLLGLLVILLAGLAASQTLSDNALRRYKGIFEGGSTQSEIESTQGRIDGYKVGFRIMKENPVLGVGPGNWSVYRSRRMDGQKLLPHNLTGQLLAAVGLVGTLAFVYYLLTTFVFAIRARRMRKKSRDPWERAVRTFIGAMLFTVFLLLVSGLGAHNLARAPWFWAPALIVVATRVRVELPGPNPQQEPA